MGAPGIEPGHLETTRSGSGPLYAALPGISRPTESGAIRLRASGNHFGDAQEMHSAGESLPVLAYETRRAHGEEVAFDLAASTAEERGESPRAKTAAVIGR